MEIKSILKNFFTLNFNKKLVSFLLAVIVWFFANNDRSSEEYLLFEVPVIYTAVKSDQVVVSELLSNATITLKASRNLSKELTRNYKVVIDLSKLKIGTNKVRLTAENFVGPKEDLWATYPDTINITLDQKVEREVKVALKSSGLSAKDLANYDYTPKTILVNGPKGQLDRIVRIETDDISGENLDINAGIEVGLQLPKFVTAPNAPLITVTRLK